MESNSSHRWNAWVRQSITVRLLAVGVIALLLLIPLQFATSLIAERANRQQEVIDRIHSSWGNGIGLQGPMLRVPYRESVTTTRTDAVTGKETREIQWVTRYLYFFPDSLDIQAKAETDQLAYGIYESVIYKTDIAIHGEFGQFEFDSLAIPPAQIDWDRASILLYCSSLKGIQEQARIQVGTDGLDFKPVYGGDVATGRMETRSFSLNPEHSHSFELNLSMKGSEYLEFVPIGKITRARMESNWPSPSFTGEFLPSDEGKEIGENGFSARWNVLEINRSFGQTFTDLPPNFTDPYANGSFRVDFVVPVDDYQKVTRTSKYGFMVISLTLFVFLIIQLVSKRYIHPLQYFLIGLALVTFYTLLLSITEHSNYLFAYLLSGGAVVVLISLYAISVFRSARTSLWVFLCLLLLYAFIYVIVQLEDYALLTGSIGIFLILALIMFVTRNLDWNIREN